MRKIIYSLFIIAGFTLSSCAQTTHNKELTGENTRETENSLNLTASQKEKIREINRGIGLNFENIGRDNTLSGYEKGEKKRELALQHKKDIYAVLTEEQRIKWENQHGNESNHKHHNNSIKDNFTNNIDDKIEALEDKYKAEKRLIEDNMSLGKEEMKFQKKKLEKKFKQEKEILKTKKNEIRNSELLQGM